MHLMLKDNFLFQIERRDEKEHSRGENSMCKGTEAWKSVFLRTESSSYNTKRWLVSGWFQSRPGVLSPT